MTRFWRSLAALPLVFVAACAALAPKSFTFEEADLQRSVDRRFPLERRYLEVLDVTVAKPQMRVLSERHKVGTTLDVDARDRLFGGGWHGNIAVESALRYEPADRTVRLAQVRVNEFRLDGSSGAARNQSERIGSLLAEKLLENMVVYKLADDKFAQLNQWGLEPGGVAITSRGIEISLAPRRN